MKITVGESFLGKEFLGANKDNEHYQECTFCGAFLKTCSMVDSISKYCDYEYVRAEDSDFSGSNFSNADFQEAVFENCVFDGAVFSDCDFRDAEFNNCSLIGCTFENCDFDDTMMNGLENQFTGLVTNGKEFPDFFAGIVGVQCKN